MSLRDKDQRYMIEVSIQGEDDNRLYGFASTIKNAIDMQRKARVQRSASNDAFKPFMFVVTASHIIDRKPQADNKKHSFQYMYGRLIYRYTLHGAEAIAEHCEKAFIKPKPSLIENPTYEDLLNAGHNSIFYFDVYPTELIEEAVTKIQDSIHLVNGYKVRFNEIFNKWILSHEEIAACIGDYSKLSEAFRDALKG